MEGTPFAMVSVRCSRRFSFTMPGELLQAHSFETCSRTTSFIAPRNKFQVTRELHEWSESAFC